MQTIFQNNKKLYSVEAMSCYFDPSNDRENKMWHYNSIFIP